MHRTDKQLYHDQKCTMIHISCRASLSTEISYQIRAILDLSLQPFAFPKSLSSSILPENMPKKFLSITCCNPHHMEKHFSGTSRKGYSQSIKNRNLLWSCPGQKECQRSHGVVSQHLCQTRWTHTQRLQGCSCSFLLFSPTP